MKNSNKMTSNMSVDNVVFNGILTVVNKNKNSWVGTMTDLNSALQRVLGKQSQLPGSPAALRIVTNRVINRLRNRKISVKFSRTAQTRLIKLVKTS